MKRLPKSTWFDTKQGLKCRVLWYVSKTKSYRVEWQNSLGSWWGAWRSYVPVVEFKEPRFMPPTAWTRVIDGVDLGDDEDPS